MLGRRTVMFNRRAAARIRRVVRRNTRNTLHSDGYSDTDSDNEEIIDHPHISDEEDDLPIVTVDVRNDENTYSDDDSVSESDTESVSESDGPSSAPASASEDEDSYDSALDMSHVITDFITEHVGDVIKEYNKNHMHACVGECSCCFETRSCVCCPTCDVKYCGECLIETYNHNHLPAEEIKCPDCKTVIPLNVLIRVCDNKSLIETYMQRTEEI